MEAKQQEWIIYITTNLINKKIYVGVRELKHDSSDDRYLGSGKIIKRAIEKYGKENFNKEILVYCYSAKEADTEEVYWIDKLDARNPLIGYNIHVGGNNQSGKNNASYGSTNKAVKCIETGITYESMKEAERQTGICMAQIGYVCRGKSITAGGFTWEYLNEPSLKRIKQDRGNKIYCFTNNKVYENAQVAGKELNLDPSTILKVCKKIKLHTGGYKFRLNSDVDFQERKDKQNIPIMCIDDNLVFPCITEASRYYGISDTTIRKIMNGNKSKVTSLKFIKLTD